MAYVDGFLLPVPKKNLAAYKRIARAACKIWLEHGALEYRECVGEDLSPGFGVPFPKMAGCKAAETVMFSWILYTSRKHRDSVCKKVMADPRLAKMMDPKKPPFDCARMGWGGFEVMVEGKRKR